MRFPTMNYVARLGARKIVIPSLLAVGAMSGWAASTTTFPTRAVPVEAIARKADPTIAPSEELKPTLIGSYAVSGTDPDGRAYLGASILDISLAPSGALELTWDNGRSVGVGQVIGNVLVVSSVANGRTAILIMNINSNGSLSGKLFRRTDRGSKGSEIWKKTT
jgi:hypothetical protein